MQKNIYNTPYCEKQVLQKSYFSVLFYYIMLYQLPNGKCVELSVEQYLRMSDEELNLYVAYNIGEEVNDPFALSVLKHGPIHEKELEAMADALLDLEEEEKIEDLTEILPEEKLYDDDYIDLDSIES